MKKKWIYGIGVGILILLGAITSGSFYMLDYALKPAGLVERSRDIQGSLEHMFQEYPELLPWVDSLQTVGALRDLYMENGQGEMLHGLYIFAPKPTRKTAVIVHGYTDNSIRMLMIGYLYNHELQYNVLLPDLHGHGLSQGKEVQMGWKDRLDILQWTEKAEEIFGHSNSTVAEGDSACYRSAGIQMVIHGISMGAATIMMVAGEVEHGLHQQPYVKCFVEDCGYTSVWDEFCGELKKQFGLPTFPLLHATSLVCRWKYGWDFHEASSLEQLKKSTRPMLFIHGDADTFVPTWMVHPLYEAKPGEKELWLPPGVKHACSYKNYPCEYTERVRNFVEKYLR